MKFHHVKNVFLLLALMGFMAGESRAGSSPYRGLWVGEATMNFVNEVSIPLDEDNVPRASDPLVATPTADQASLRLILHVNGAGQTSLLKEVAIVNRTTSGEGSESDLALITEESFYVGLEPQVAVRIASATFDFGDSQTTTALDAVVDAIVNDVTNAVFTATSVQFASDATRDALIVTVAGNAQVLGDSIIDKADVTPAFDQFLQTYWDANTVDEIATNPVSPKVSTAQTQAAILEAGSFYGDRRASEMIPAVQLAAAAAATPAEKMKAAQSWTAAFADVADLYHRFIAGQVFGTMIKDAASAAAQAASTNGATLVVVRASVDTIGAVVAAETDALNASVSAYRDERSTAAIDLVLTAMVTTAVNTTGSVAFVQATVEQAGWDTLSDVVPRYPVSPQIPTPGYDEFIVSDDFLASAERAAEAAAQAAVEERRDNSLYTSASLLGAAKVAAVNALRTVYGAAARTVDSGIPLEGVFGSTNSVLKGTVFLPANHPTNPFRHRRHPDHTTGFDITRELEISFSSGSADPLSPIGFGVQQISGALKEEIHGLYKPLGTDPSTPIGLISIGAFELQRISLIDTLNTL